MPCSHIEGTTENDPGIFKKCHIGGHCLGAGFHCSSKPSSYAVVKNADHYNLTTSIAGFAQFFHRERASYVITVVVVLVAFQFVPVSVRHL